VHALPLIVALLVALPVAPAVLRMLAAGGHVRPNYRGRELPFPFGLSIVAAATLALIPLALLQQLGEGDVLYTNSLRRSAVYILGVALLGLADDTLQRNSHAHAPSAHVGDDSANTDPRGWRGHGGALLRGELSTGALKAFGSLGLALFVLSGGAVSSTRSYLLAVAVLVLATNLFNLLDLRPGRASKAFVLLAAGLTIGAAQLRTLWSLGVFVGPALVAGAYDLRERAMLGDTGANLIGALAGWWLLSTLNETGWAIALVLLALLTVYGEFRSISTFVERTPLLRGLDSLGRPS
jgi:UDP-N-acetylmuramyl pentapeptide phosphotransferase/UDP-N-acetylglucosamine-1-phosphate transferase